MKLVAAVKTALLEIHARDHVKTGAMQSRIKVISGGLTVRLFVALGAALIRGGRRLALVSEAPAILNEP
jgi:hypothetical protein